MSFLFYREAFKFYKLKSERLLQLLFLLLLGVNLFSVLHPFGDNDFSGFMNSVDDMVIAVRMGRQPVWSDLSLTRGNVITLAVFAAAFVLNILLVLLYAGAYSAERIGVKGSKGAIAMLKAWPKAILTLIFLMLIGGMTSLVMFIPALVLASGFAFSFFFFSEKKLSLIQGLKRSWAETRGRKLIIALNMISMNFILSLLTNLIAALLAPFESARLLFSPLLTTITALISGRLLGLMYVFFTRQTFSLGEGKTTLVTTDVQVLFDDVLLPQPDDAFLQEERKKKK